MVNANGVRFVDEGADFRNYTYAKYGAGGSWRSRSSSRGRYSTPRCSTGCATNTASSA